MSNKALPNEITIDEFPYEYFIPIEGEEYFRGRLTINDLNGEFAVEIDLVQVGSGKIYRHVGIYAGQPTAKEAIEYGRHEFYEFLSKTMSSSL